MDVKEIERYLVAGSLKSVCISRTLSLEYPGIVRDVSICRDFKVKIEFNSYGYFEGGIYIVLTYGNQQKLFESLERFLGEPMSSWDNISKSDWYPEAQPEIEFDILSSGERLRRDLKESSLLFPEGWENFELLNG